LAITPVGACSLFPATAGIVIGLWKIGAEKARKGEIWGEEKLELVNQKDPADNGE